MRIQSLLLVSVMVLGLVGMADAKKIVARAEGGSEIAQSLHQAHALLVEADHDYDGHRIKAVHRLHAALKEMGVAEDTARAKGAVRSRKSGEHEPQAASDAKLREALSILQGVAGHVGNPKADEHVQGAITEINTALSLK